MRKYDFATNEIGLGKYTKWTSVVHYTLVNKLRELEPYEYSRKYAKN